MKKTVLLFTVACTLLTGCRHLQLSSKVEGSLKPHLGEAKFDLQPLFSGERFGNVVVSMEGTIIATWGTGHVRARRSEDGGQTWGPEIVIAKPGFQTGGLTVNEDNGDIIAFVEDRHPPAPIHVYVSSDDGKTWNKIETNIKPDSKGNDPSMHMNEHGITLRHGEHKGRLIRPSRWYAGKNDRSKWPQHYTNAIYSDDGGKSWQASEPFPANGTGEATIAELSDGTIYYNSRRHWAEEGANPRRRWTATSTDGGHIWKNLTYCDALPDGPQNTNYGCMGGLTRLAVKGRDILIYSNCDSPSGRVKGTVWASFDGGKTWPIKRLVFKGPHAYSSLTSGRPGTATEGVIIHHFEGGPKGGSAVAQFNLAWILEGGTKTGDGELPSYLN
ncbi:MAG: sialidase family protein [Verrucomicrobiota bacterium]|nr:sialidase family protein [Verrucomicrobiota bacterium]MDP7049452.1 sialidase family protein [Verrucomicrobiota bacterium]